MATTLRDGPSTARGGHGPTTACPAALCQRRRRGWAISRPIPRQSYTDKRRPLYAVPVFVLSVPPQTVQRYRQRRPHFVGNEPWPTMLRPSFPRLSHPRLAQAMRHPVDRVHRSRVPGGNPRFSPKISEVKATEQQRPAQAPLGGGEIDAASFSAIRLLSGALALAAIHAVRRGARTPRRAGWFSAALLFLYAVPFSFAYNTFTTGTARADPLRRGAGHDARSRGFFFQADSADGRLDLNT